MRPDDLEKEIAQILDARAGQSALASGESKLEQYPELRELLEAADVAWISEQSAPPIAEDPVAAMLGLVPDADLELDGRALSNARKGAALTVNGLAERLGVRGWEVTAKDVFAWESGKNLPHIPALIGALAEECGIDADRLRRAGRADPERARLAAVIDSDAFRGLARRWARIQKTTLTLASSTLESRLLVAVHRGGAPDAAALLDSLEAMVSAVEGADES